MSTGVHTTDDDTFLVMSPDIRNEDLEEFSQSDVDSFHVNTKRKFNENIQLGKRKQAATYCVPNKKRCIRNEPVRQCNVPISGKLNKR